MEEIHLKKGVTTLVVKCLHCGQARPLRILVDEKTQIVPKRGLQFQNDVSSYSNIDKKAMEDVHREIQKQLSVPLRENQGYNNFESMQGKHRQPTSEKFSEAQRKKGFL